MAPGSPLGNMTRGTLIAGVVGLSAVLAACDEKASATVQTVKIGGKWFHLELALDDQTRAKGLGQREFIEPDGGMLFVFTQAEPRAFVMRDCPIPIDIIYLDATGRVVSFYEMQPEPPRGEGEGQPGDFTNQKYESRLKQYPSRFPTQFVIELKGATLPGLGLKEGDRIDLPIADLRRRAR